VLLVLCCRVLVQSCSFSSFFVNNVSCHLEVLKNVTRINALVHVFFFLVDAVVNLDFSYLKFMSLAKYKSRCDLANPIRCFSYVYIILS
jgi:hypothetical protein